MALSIEDKKKIVSDVNELANNASSLVLADARGLKVAEANELRSEGHKSNVKFRVCLLYTSPSPRDNTLSRMPSSA